MLPNKLLNPSPSNIPGISRAKYKTIGKAIVETLLYTLAHKNFLYFLKPRRLCVFIKNVDRAKQSNAAFISIGSRIKAEALVVITNNTFN